MCIHVNVRNVKWGRAVVSTDGGGCISEVSFSRISQYIFVCA